MFFFKKVNKSEIKNIQYCWAINSLERPFQFLNLQCILYKTYEFHKYLWIRECKLTVLKNVCEVHKYKYILKNDSKKINHSGYIIVSTWNIDNCIYTLGNSALWFPMATLHLCVMCKWHIDTFRCQFLFNSMGKFMFKCEE